MIYPESFEDKLRFNRIKELIKEECISTLGTERVDKIEYLVSPEKIAKLGNQTEEFRQICLNELAFQIGTFVDVRQPLNRIRVEGLYLEEQELFDLKRSLQSVKDIVRFFSSKEETEYPNLRELATKVVVYPYIIERIERILNKYGKIKDNATPELASIKNELFKTQANVSKRMSSILSQAKKDGLVEADTNIAVRDGRSVIPVISANKRRLQGIIHDESATGKTSYIEPAEIVELNNHIRELEYAERREITKILIDIATDIRPYLDDLLFSYQFLGIMDFIRAKAKFAIKTNSILPKATNDQTFDWIEATHPLLYLKLKSQNEQIVPLDLKLGGIQRIVLISGPNAGGKSVCLQTVGLLQYMHQCGLLIPVKEGSTVGIFNDIFIDMGDEQSIENDLSTYSSHLTNMRHFLRNATEKSLILIDEFGTGTEPMLGGAIAESVLASLNQKKISGVITTHYTNLKHFASNTEGITNGGMLFDTHRIQPLFKLQIGQPGSSFAFEIARKIGLPDDVLNEAKEKLGQDHFNFDKHLREITRDKRYWEEKRESIRKNDKQLQLLIDQYSKDLQTIKAERKEILEKAKNEAKTLLQNTNKTIENVVREIKEAQAEKERTKIAREELSEIKKSIEEKNLSTDDKIDQKIAKMIERQQRSKEKKEGAHKSDISSTAATNSAQEIDQTEEAPLAEGDTVLLDNKEVTGTIISTNGTDAMIALGNIITKVKITRLTKISKREEKKLSKTSIPFVEKSTYDRIRERKLNFKPDIDLRGVRGSEAMEQLTNFIDDAVMCSASSVRILHGKGNGILRTLVRDFLKTVSAVESFADEHVQFGGSGITVVKFR